MGDLSRDHSAITASVLIRDVWPQIRKEIPDAELHIYSSGHWKQALSKD